MMLNCFGIDKYDKLHGFMIHSVMLSVCRISHENDYSFQFSNVGSYVYVLFPPVSYAAYLPYVGASGIITSNARFNNPDQENIGHY